MLTVRAILHGSYGVCDKDVHKQMLFPMHSIKVKLKNDVPGLMGWIGTSANSPRAGLLIHPNMKNAYKLIR